MSEPTSHDGPGHRQGRLPLSVGDSGHDVVDLQERLAAVGLDVDEPRGRFGKVTEDGVRLFQERRGLPSDGICGRHTWEALVEAGYRLGDRLLYRRSPMLRGDDVAELQSGLSTLGFDPGRIDGIFGDQTAVALLEFQHNAGLVRDGICGRRTMAELARLSLHGDASQLVSQVRERLRLGDRPGDLRGRTIAVVEGGGFAAGVAAVCRALGDAGAVPLPLHHPDPRRQAAEANAVQVDCLLSLGLAPDRLDCSTAFYRGFRYESATSRRLAELIQAALPAALALDDGGIHGMALPILRETRMPAVDIRLGAPSLVVQRVPDVGQVLVNALLAWTAITD